MYSCRPDLDKMFDTLITCMRSQLDPNISSQACLQLSKLSKTIFKPVIDKISAGLAAAGLLPSNSTSSSTNASGPAGGGGRRRKRGQHEVYHFLIKKVLWRFEMMKMGIVRSRNSV